MITKILYRCMFYEKDGRIINRLYLSDKTIGKFSPWHEISLHMEDIKDLFPAVVTLSKYNLAHFEINRQLEFNPLEQLQVINPKTGQPENRFYRQFPSFNYAFLPQTWYDSTKQDYIHTEYMGDGQPIGIVDLGDTYFPIGHVLTYRIIGAFCMCVHGCFASWKMLAIPEVSELNAKLKNLKEYENEFPGRIDTIIRWFERASILEGDNPAFNDGPIKDREFALKIVEEGWKGWKKLKLPEYRANFNCWMREEEIMATALVVKNKEYDPNFSYLKQKD